MGYDTTLGDDYMAEQPVQFFIVANSELQMTRDDTLFLVITSSVSGEFKDFSSKIFENGSEVYYEGWQKLLPRRNP